MVHKIVHYKTFNIAGFTYCEGALIFNELKIGTVLSIKADPKNKYDPKAIEIYYGEYKLGYVPRTENKTLSKLLEAGHIDVFKMIIQAVRPEAYPEEQITVGLYIKKIETDNPQPRAETKKSSKKS